MAQGIQWITGNVPKHSSDKRIQQIQDLMVQLAAGNLNARGAPSETGDDLDAIIVGLNMLAEELQANIAERDRAEEVARTSDERFRALIENSADAITLLDANGITIYDSPAAPGLLGYAPGELIGQPAFELVHPDDLPHALELFQEVVRIPGGHTHNIFRLHHKNGSWRWIEGIAINLLNEPVVNAVVVNYRDITERRQAEEALRESEIKYRSLVNEVSDGMYISDERGVLSFANNALARILGVENPEALVGHSFSEFIPRGKTGQLEEQYYHAMAAGPGSGVVVAEVLRRDGSSAFVEIVPQANMEDGHFVGNRGVVRDITERRQAEQKIQRQLERLTALNEIDRAIASSFGLNISLGTVLNYVTQLLDVDAASVLLFNPSSKTLSYAAGRGFRTNAFERAGTLRIGEGYAGRAALERTTLHIPDLAERNDNPRLQKALPGEGFVSYYCVPLITKGEVTGVLEIFHRAPLKPDKDWLGFLQTLAGQAAIAIDNATLFDGLQRSNIELTLAYEATIEGWSRALDLRAEETEGHTQRIMDMSWQLARRFDLSDKELTHIRRGALLHDIGKMGVPDSILLKPGPLTDEEWVIIRRHPQFAFDMLSPIRYLQAILDIPYCHHEKWDGSGYPRGLKGEEIPLAARIFAVVDVYDALTSNRPYRAAWTKEAALEYIRSQSGKHFEPRVVDAFMGLINSTSD